MCNNNTTSSVEYSFGIPEKIGFTITYLVIIILGIGGNAVVCYIILRDLKTSVTNLFLLNLSLADILMTLVVVPMSATMDIWLTNWPFGMFMCKLVPFIQCFAVLLISLTHVVISCDRFVIVFYPMRKRISRRNALLVILVTWILAGLQALPLFVVSSQNVEEGATYCSESWGSTANMVYTLVLLVLQYFLPLVFISGTYSAITAKLWGRSAPGESNAIRDKRIAQSKRKMVKMMIVVALMYAISQLPRYVIHLLGMLHSWCQPWMRLAWNGVVLLSTSSSCYNPFIYCWMNKVYRKGFLRLLSPCRRQWERSDHQRGETTRAQMADFNSTGEALITASTHHRKHNRKKDNSNAPGMTVTTVTAAKAIANENQNDLNLRRSLVDNDDSQV